MSMETQSSSEGQSSQSSGGKKKKAPIKHIPLKIHGIKRYLDGNLGLGPFHLEMPYDPKTTRFEKYTYPLRFLDVKDADQLETLKVMKMLSHPNILEISLINQVKGEEGARVYVEPYTGVLSELLKQLSLVDPKTKLIPSEPFRNIVSEVVDGLNYLRENKEYHGNFSLATTFYLNDRSKIITKLANFERKGTKSLEECQAADCVSLGFGLAEITQYVRQRQAVIADSCHLIDDLSRRLISVTPETLATVMDGIKDRVFFWDEKRRKSFLAIEVPEAWDAEAFRASFTVSASRPTMPWTDKLYDGYLVAMKSYRAANGIGEFDPNDWKDFLRCMSGMYIHQTELDVDPQTKPVDSCVLAAHPRLFLDLKAAVDQLAQPPVEQPAQPLAPVA